MRVPKIKLYPGLRFGKLELLSINQTVEGESEPKWSCLCDCGNITRVAAGSIRSGATSSCGCFRKEFVKRAKTTHGKTKTVEYKTWAKIKARCFDINDRKYPIYGGRGITVCEEWKNDFLRFLTDMGERPENCNSIDRIDVNGNYEKTNCRWSNPKEQANNRTSARLIEFNGETKSVHDWSIVVGISSSTIRRRLDLGWPVEEALSVSVRSVRNNNRIRSL